MVNSQQNLVKLQDLSFISGETQNDGANALVDQERQKIKQKFATVENLVKGFFSKIFPQSIDLICAQNRLISRKNKIFLFKNKEVEAVTLTYENCLDVCQDALTAFPNTLNAMVIGLKTRTNTAYLEEISQKLCREFNTISEFQSNSESFLNERIANLQISRKAEKVKPMDYSDNFSKLITIPIGKNGSQEISIELNTLRPDAHAVIAGMSGSGKSSLLQSLILGGAYNYSPDQLQFWILDFKDGTGLIQFKALKHVKVMSVKNRPIDANEIMDYINGEYLRRAELIRNSGGGDITAYNMRAKAENKPLLPRLLIIIDEFAVMHRSCFSLLNNIVVRGRSMGMGFILSSQIIETGAAYGDTVQQANHLFEFKNSDSVFGRLVKNVSEEERRFACSGVIGNCLYRRDTVKTAFRVAYAGDLEEQNELIKTINDKWSDFPYREPIITGSPERKMRQFSLISVDGQEKRDKFDRTKKVFVPIGESRMGEPYLYKIDRENPLLLAFGDEERVASVELSIIEHFKVLLKTEKAVYYVDLNCNPDREENAVTSKYGVDSEEICYADTDNGAKRIIDKIYTILKNRRQMASSGIKDIGNPIELIIHNTERISELADEKTKPTIGVVTRSTTSTLDFSADLDLDEILAGMPKSKEVLEEKDDIGTLKKLREIIENGKNSRIYVMLYFEERHRLQSLESSLFNYNYEFKDVIVVPRIPEEYEELSYSEVVDSLNTCRLREQASALGQASDKTQGAALEQNDFICAVLVDDKVPHKIIPYEWTVK